LDMTFEKERLLVDHFVCILQSDSTPFGDLQVLCEFNYSRGCTDVVALSSGDHVIAFEAKLRDWRTALHQAYRNTCFANQSFVLLPKDKALRAMTRLEEFRARGVGLCYLDGARIVVLHDSPCSTPLEPWLALEAVSQFHQYA
jgi:hypothetical protein